MKKILFALSTFLCLAFLGCTSDNEDSVAGQYLFQNDTLTVAVSFEKGGVAYLHIFTNNSIEFQDISTVSRYIGEYPNYTVSIAGVGGPTLVLSCAFASYDTFTATVMESHLDDVFWLYRERHIYLPQMMLFKRDKRILDTNGDGVLDWTQDLY